MKLAHIINPVKAPPNTELGIVQPITFASIKNAYDFAKGQANVELFAIGYEEDREVTPAYFNILPNLTRSILDMGTFTRPRKYPLMMDVFRSVLSATDAEYIIFTNMDIGLMPQFYVAVNSLITTGGYDVLLVNRRGISGKYKSEDELPLMYSDFGMPHPGFDCFIFHRSMVEKILMEDICVGVSFSEVALVHNFIAFAGNLKLVDDLHLTFHIGTEVMPPLDPEYYGHNRRVYETIIYPQLKPLLTIDKFPYSQLPLHKRMIKWMLNPSFRTHQVVEMEGKSFWRRMKYKLDAIRFGTLEKIK